MILNLSELLVALLTPIASYIGKKIVEKIKNKKDQEKIKIDIKSPNYNGTANHWISNLFEKTKIQEVKRLEYAYIGNELNTGIEKDSKASTIKLHIPNVNRDALKELLSKNKWNNQNDPIHGNGVFNLALPQITYANFESESYQINYQDLSSIPLGAKYMFTTKLETSNFEKKDPDDFYRHGGIFEIPIYLEQSTPNYQVYPVTPPAPKIPEYAIRTRVLKEPEIDHKVDEQIFVFCPFCGTRFPKTKELKFCLSCGKNIENYINF